MDGEIGVNSEPGRGSVFWFTARVGLAGLAPAPEPEATPTDDAVQGRRPTSDCLPILVVDDSLINRLVTSRMLKHLGYDVTSVESGAQALDVLSQESFGLILTDCYMPDMDGFSLTEEIRRSDRQVPIVAMTADVLDETRGRCLASGMNDCLTKPLRIEQLERVIQRWGPVSTAVTAAS
jgi:two-component system CheB/CheR fusion protein